MAKVRRGKAKGTKDGPHPGKTQGRLSPTKRRYAKARGNGASMRAACAAAGLKSARAKEGVTGAEWEKDPAMQAAIDFYREQIPMQPVELNNRLAAKVRAVPAREMGIHELRAAELLSKNLGLQKQSFEHSGPEGAPLFADTPDEKLAALAQAAVERLSGGTDGQ